MYYIMNKDVTVAAFDKRNHRWSLLHKDSKLPIGKFEINDWIEDRKAYKHNHHLRRLMKDCGCDTAEGFIRITHAASINDSFWIKEENETATKCKAFTNEDIGFVPLRKLVDRSITINELLKFFDDLGCREKFQRMLVLDAVTFNTDRHLGNVGILINNDTQEMIGIAPNFDFNLSMLPYVAEEEFNHIGSRLLDYAPAIGDDFTRIGQAMLTSEIRKDLIHLQGFSFSFRGDRQFAPGRVEIMEEMVNRQISAILL